MQRPMFDSPNKCTRFKATPTQCRTGQGVVLNEAGKVSEMAFCCFRAFASLYRDVHRNNMLFEVFPEKKIDRNAVTLQKCIAVD